VNDWFWESSTLDYDINDVDINIDDNVDKFNIIQVRENKFDVAVDADANVNVNVNFQNNHCFRILYEDLKITLKLTSKSS
jgi:hypothetical protein